MSAGTSAPPGPTSDGPRSAPIRARRVIVIAGVAVVALALLGILFVPLAGPDENEGSTPLLGTAAPDIDLASLDGTRVQLSELRGRPVIVNFWATWCIPCREEFPLLATAYAEHATDGLEILGVIHDDSVDGARRFAEAHGATWPMLLDADDAAWADYIGVGLPMSFFIDREGVVRGFSLGGFSEAGLDRHLERILPGDRSA